MEEKKLSMKEYAQTVKELIGMVYENVDVQVFEVIKNNGKRCEAITLQQNGENVTPVLYLDGFYQDYLKTGFMESVHMLLEVYQNSRYSKYVDLEFFSTYENVKSHLFPRLVNFERNRNILKDFLHMQFLDLAVMIHYVGEFDRVSFCVPITIEYMRKWGKSIREIYADALRNMKNCLYYNPLFDEMTWLSGEMEAYLEEDETFDRI